MARSQRNSSTDCERSWSPGRSLEQGLTDPRPERQPGAGRTPYHRAMQELWTCHLGLVEYREAVALQERLRERVQAGELPDLLLLLEHPPVYTLGPRSQP